MSENYKNTPFWDNDLSLEERLDYLIKEMTLEEKIQCLTTGAPKITRLGLEPCRVGGEAAHGIEARHDQDKNRGEPQPTTTFTQPIGMSSTWDTSLIEKAGSVVGNEARALRKKEKMASLSRWAPTIDMERDPRWGRTEEAYGEDPFLTGKMSSAYIHGMQGRDSFYLKCAATLKHFYANNVEEDRIKTSSSIDPRNKHEYYLEPFRRAVMEGNAEAMMTAYNEINGTPAIVNDEVLHIVKNQWGLKGHVVCDGGDFSQTVDYHKYFKTHAETLAYGLKAGIDCFTDSPDLVHPAAREALEKGLITEEDINQSIYNSFSTKLRLGFYDAKPRCPYDGIGVETLNCDEHQQICKEVARKSMILLKNENQMLPLDKNTKETIAVVGPLAQEWYKDWYSGIPPYSVTPLDGIKKEFQQATITSTKGLNRVKLRIGTQYLVVGEDGAVRVGSQEEAESFEHTDWGFNKHTFKALSNGKFLTANDEGNRITATKEEAFGWFVKESFFLYESDECGSDSLAQPPSEGYFHENKECSIRIETWNHKPLAINELGALVFEDKEQDEIVRNVIMEVITDGIQQAVELSKKADKVIAVVGCNPMINSKEEIDRTDIILPPEQRRLLQQIYQVNKNVILVLITNYPYAIDWEKDNIPAILTTATGSQELGTGIAETLSGDNRPAGRLNMTWYKDVSQLPPIDDYDIIQGNRTYQYFEGEVLYPFGYGLTYTDFHYSDINVSMEEDKFTVLCKVKNVGKLDSDEVVQLYVSQQSSRTKRPIRQLKGFQRVWLAAGEEKELHFSVAYDELKYYDVVTQSMLLEESDYVIGVGASSEDIRVESTIFIPGVQIGNRDLSKLVRGDHYDHYYNLQLHEGLRDKSCIMVGPYDTWGKAIYRNIQLEKTPKSLVITAKARREGHIQVYYGEQMLGSACVKEKHEFQEIIIPVDSIDVSSKHKNELVLRLEGDVRIVEFEFLW